MSRADDLTPLFFPPPSDELGFRQGTVISFDLSNGQNVIDVGGTQLVNVPLLSVIDSVSLMPGNHVALLTWKSSWWILGRVILANSPDFGQLCVFENNGEGVCITKNGIDIYPPDPPNDVARIFAQRFPLDGRMWLEMIPPRTIGTTGSNRFILEGGSSQAGTNGAFFLITAGSGSITAAGNITIDATGIGIYRSTGSVFLESFSAGANVIGETAVVVRADAGSVFVDAQSGSVVITSDVDQCFIDHTTTASAANCFIATNGLIQRSTSSLRYKTDVEDFHVNTDTVLALQPRVWRDRTEVAEDPTSENWHVGFIAEELDALGLTSFVDYDEVGQPESIAYDRLSVALLSVVKAQNARLGDIETRLAALDGKMPTEHQTELETVKPRRHLRVVTKPDLIVDEDAQSAAMRRASVPHHAALRSEPEE